MWLLWWIRRLWSLGGKGAVSCYVLTEKLKARIGLRKGRSPYRQLDGADLLGSLILWYALLRTSRGPQSSWAPKEGWRAKRTWITGTGPSALSSTALILTCALIVSQKFSISIV